jgi:subtilase family serine protease
MSRSTNSLARSLVGLAAASALVASVFVAVPAVATPDERRATPSAVVPDKLTFTAVLNYDRRALLADARAISSPGTPRYRNFLTLKQAATKFGMTRTQREALRAAASKLGVTVSYSATGLTADLTAPVETWNRIYGGEPSAIPGPPWVTYAYVDEQGNFPPVPESLRSHVRLIFAGAASLDPSVETKRSSAGVLSTDDTPPVNVGTPFGPGAECLPPPALPYTYSPMQIHTPYGTKALQEKGLTGSGARIANLGGGYAYTEEYLEYFSDCFEFRAPPIRFTGGPGVGPDPVRTSGDDEGNLDIQVIAAVVPDISPGGGHCADSTQPPARCHDELVRHMRPATPRL